jgi:hypothetical protein
MDFVTRRRYETNLALFVEEINLHNTIREVEAPWPEYGYLIFSFLQIMIFQYFAFSLSVFKYCLFQSYFKDYWVSKADVTTPTWLYLMQI